jgi:1,2-diacylglycerol 3-beta-galactosyltransferase
MQSKKKILILTADAGFGHRSAANAIAASVMNTGGTSFECRIFNPADDPRTPDIIRRPQADYDWTVRTVPHTYQLSYEISDTYPASRAIEIFVSQCMFELFEELLKTYTPDAVISTYPLYNTALHSALVRTQLNIPFFVVITDLTNVHHLWFQPGPDWFFVPTERARQAAIRSHIPPERIVVTGIPVDTRIAQEKRSKDSLRLSLGWDPNMPVVLAVGSNRVMNLLDYLHAVDRCKSPLQLAVVAGGNNNLFEKTRASTWQSPLHCYNYTENLHEMLHAADLLMTKAGGLITSEALACGLPLIFVEAIAGQETGNMQYVCKNSAGVMAKTPLEALSTIEGWLAKNRMVLDQFSRNAQEL